MQDRGVREVKNVAWEGIKLHIFSEVYFITICNKRLLFLC